ncbi:hypothetical protein GCM10010495_44690 [Kitasatospora herbaricolor]|nr:hypothetical protein [Kitasatospora herbaricolor]GGV24057.1 hypothetical protein GCM10010495_44690 [Kitasatospora herbaricolor]
MTATGGEEIARLRADVEALVGALQQPMTEDRMLQQAPSKGLGVVQILPEPRNSRATHPVPPDPT